MPIALPVSLVGLAHLDDAPTYCMIDWRLVETKEAVIPDDSSYLLFMHVFENTMGTPVMPSVLR